MSAAPASLQPHERLAELAELFARGIQRLLAHEVKADAKPRNSREQLDAAAEVEAPCRSRVLSPRTRTA